ncbi:unnamed protein product [Ectocarpus sp. CCAP 1310/34]|nr:unnamed protein product [Ectocarpus sp. CCAP 1310/34]
MVFRCAEPGKGWGLRCVEPIPAGSFVACYLGEVLTDRSVDDRGRQTHDDYVFGLDFAKCAARPGHSGGARAGGLSKEEEEAFGDFVVSPNRERLLEGFVAATGCTSRERAAYFLRGAGGDLAVAVNHFLDAPAGAGAGDARGAAYAAIAAGAGAGADADAGADAGADTAAGVGEDNVPCADDDADDEMGEWEDNGSGSGSGNHAPGDGGGGGDDDDIADGSPPAHLSETERRRWVRHHNQRERMMYLRQQEVSVEQHVPRNGAGDDVAAQSPAPPLSCEEAKQAGDGATAGGGAASSTRTTVSPPSSPAEVLWQEVGDDFGSSEAVAEAGAGMLVPPWRHGSVAIVAEPLTKNVVPSGATSPPSSSATPPPSDELPNPKRIRRGGDLHESLCEVVDPPGHPPPGVSSPGPPRGSGGSGEQWLTRRKDKAPGKPSTPSMATPATAMSVATAGVSTPTSATTAASTPTAETAAVSTPTAATTAAQEEVNYGEGLFAEIDLSLEDESTTVSQTRSPHKDAAVSTAEEAHRTPPPSRNIAARTHAAAGGGPGVDIAAAGAGGGGNEVDFEVEAWTPSSPRSDVSPEMAVDAKDFGNVARFMNHSCDGNLVKKMVFVEGHDFRIPRVAFFSLEKIQAYEELTYDYNYKVGSVEGKSLACRCGAPTCRGMLL